MALHPMAEDYLDSNIDALNLNHANKVAREVHSKGLGGLGPQRGKCPYHTLAYLPHLGYPLYLIPLARALGHI